MRLLRVDFEELGAFNVSRFGTNILVSTKRFDEARVVFAKIARINRTAVNTEIFLFENEVELEVKEEQ